VIEYAKALKPSARGELEIGDLNMAYLNDGKLNTEKLGRGFAWLDAGTPDSMLEASQFIKTIQEVQNFPIACIEEIAFNNGWIDKDQLARLIADKPDTKYYKFLKNILND
jgi:glucose-1-phosphate thymidylyltransferase